MSSSSTWDSALTATFHQKVSGRIGVLPNFFCSASAAPGLIEELWSFAESAYLDNPLPSLFKERLFVHLSRFCRARYCIVRHAGFLVGLGRPAGDAQAVPESVQQVVELLSRPAVLPASEMEAVLSRLEAMRPPEAIPVPGSQSEYDLFMAASVLFLNPTSSERARKALSAALGRPQSGDSDSLSRVHQDCPLLDRNASGDSL